MASNKRPREEKEEISYKNSLKHCFILMEMNPKDPYMNGPHGITGPIITVYENEKRARGCLLERLRHIFLRHNAHFVNSFPETIENHKIEQFKAYENISQRAFDNYGEIRINKETFDEEDFEEFEDVFIILSKNTVVSG